VEFTPPRFSRLPLRGMAVFEAAARLGKFSAAAQELAMTPAGISQHVAQLEDTLGAVLFHRGRRGVTLTDTGQRFLLAVEQGFHTLAHGVADAQRLGAHPTVNILTDFGFAAWWLMPRIAMLSELMPKVDIRLITSQGSLQQPGDDVDLAVLFGEGEWPACRSRRLFGEDVVPVCAPSYLQASLGDRRPPLSAKDIASMRLLHLHGNGPQRWFEWEDWFATMGAERPRGTNELVFNNYQIVLQAVLLGQGVALGWKPLIDDLLANGSLVRLSERSLTSTRGYHLLEPVGRKPDPYAAQIAEWLVQSCHED